MYIHDGIRRCDCGEEINISNPDVVMCSACAVEALFGMPFTDYEDAKWWEKSRCAGESLDIFFPNMRSHSARRVIKNYCEQCPVRSECLEYALEAEKEGLDGGVHGIYGGMLPVERRALNQKRRMAS